jgi:hypothetical protein
MSGSTVLLPIDQHAYVYCEVQRPRRMEEDSGAHWRVTAVLHGSLRDPTPDEGWYPHI